MSRTQGGVSLSSGEAEYYAMVSALADAKQVQEVLGDAMTKGVSQDILNIELYKDYQKYVDYQKSSSPMTSVGINMITAQKSTQALTTR